MNRRTLAAVAAGVLAMATSLATAQVASLALVSQATANRYGLERAWFTQIELDRARGRVAHITQHVSSTQGCTAFVVQYDGGKAVFTEHDRGPTGEAIGKEAARKMAAQKLEELKQANRNPQLTTQLIPEITLYVMTDQAVVQAIDAETGRTRWTTPIGNPLYPSEAPGANDKYVAVVNGAALCVLDKNDGTLRWRQRTAGAPGAGPVVTTRFVVVPMVSGAIEAYELEDYRQPPWIFKSLGRAVVQPIYTGRNIAWPTDRGFLYVAEGDRSSVRFRLETGNAIVAQAALLPPNRIVTASTDGYVYCVNENSGAIQWRFSTGEPIVRPPAVIGDSVFVVTDDHSCYRLSAADGKPQWWTTGIRAILSASQKRLYCLSRAGRLTILDLATGAGLGSLPTEKFDLTFYNKQTDRIFLGSRTGLMQCLRETSQQWPVIHPGVLREQTPAGPAAPKPKRAEEPPPPEEKEPATVDPFGIEESKAKRAPAKTDDADPFGSPAPPAKPSNSGDPFASSPEK